MALHLQTFKTRTLTAIVFVIVMLCGLLINHWTFFLLFSVIHFGCWFEYKKIAGKIEPAYKNIHRLHSYAVMLAGFGFMLWMTNDAYTIAQIKLNEFGWYLMLISLIAFPVSEILLTQKFNIKTLLISIAGLIYISFSCGCMIDLRSEGMLFGSFFGIDLGLVLPLLIIATIWINDTMAYIVGSLIGKTPLSSVSPKKTWEGTIGGALLAIATVTVCGYIFFEADIMQLIIISAIACIAGILGDLFESKLKRMSGIKDSGNIMPGHGGFLDRFDSLLFATIFVWVYVKLFL
ncbi:MAG: phosphatidate cytidylyltransferase [Parafilimonas sp.]